MKKSEIIEALATKTGLTKIECEKVFNTTFEIFKDELAKGEKVSLVGFGTFATSQRAAKEGRNPKTGEKVSIAARTAATFKAGSKLKEAVNK